MQILCIIIMPSGSGRLIVSTRVIFWARTPRRLSWPAEGGCFCLATVSVLSLCPSGVWHGPSAGDFPSPSLSRKKARRDLSTLPSDCRCLSSRLQVRYCLFSSRRPRVCLCLLHFMLPHTVYSVRREPSPSLAPLPSTYCESEL